MTLTSVLLFGILVGVLLSRPGRRMLRPAAAAAIRTAVIFAVVVIAYAATEIIKTRAPGLVRLSDVPLVASMAAVALVAALFTIRLRYENID